MPANQKHFSIKASQLTPYKPTKLIHQTWIFLRRMFQPIHPSIGMQLLA
jgi:hypothetical protein